MKGSGEVEDNVHNIFRVVPEFFSSEGKFLCLDTGILRDLFENSNSEN